MPNSCGRENRSRIKAGQTNQEQYQPGGCDMIIGLSFVIIGIILVLLSLAG